MTAVLVAITVATVATTATTGVVEAASAAAAASTAPTQSAASTAAAAAVPSTLSYVPQPGWWGTNGRVTDTVAIGSRVYLAGGFDYIGPQTGYGVSVSSSTGTMAASSPVIDGVVTASAPDGSGGWYVAGDFQHVGSFVRQDAAQIDADGRVTAWNPRPDGPVNAIAVLPDKVVLGGSFGRLGSAGTAAARLGAVDRAAGAPVAGWAASFDGSVRGLVASGPSLYVAGSFRTVNGSSRTGLVRLLGANGAVDPTFAGRTNGDVNALALAGNGSTLYLGGAFSAATAGASLSTRSRLAAYDTSTGALTGWAPAADNTVLALASDPASGTVYAGGLFGAVSGVGRARLAAINTAGATTGFDAQLAGCHIAHRTKYSHNDPPCTPEVDALSVAGGSVFVAGRFGRSGSITRHNAAAFDLGTSTPSSWNPVASGRVLTLASQGAATFVGGELTSVNGLVRAGLAALSSSTGAGDPSFQADTDDLPLDLEPSADGSRLYLVGSFATVGGVSRKRIAAIDTQTGRVDTGFKANASGIALMVKAAGPSLFVSGKFVRVNNVSRVHMVKVNATTGAVDPAFVANTTGPSGPLRANGMVSGLAARKDGTRVYMGGPFTTVNGRSTPGGIAVVNGATGALLPNQLGGVQGDCHSLGPWMTYLSLSPDQTKLYGGDWCPDNVYQWDAVNLSTPSNPTGLIWMTWCNAGMQAATEVNGRLYYGSHGGDRGAGGYCWDNPTHRQPVARQRFIVFDTGTGALLPDTPQFDSPMGVWSITVLPQGLLVGGDFTFAGTRSTVRQGLALFPGTP